MENKTEDRIQQECCMWFKNTYKDKASLFFMINNAGQKNKVTANLDKAKGLTAGIPDTQLAMAKRGYNGLFVEFKTEKGVLSSEQKNVITQLEQEGYLVIICRCLEEFKDFIEWYLT